MNPTSKKEACAEVVVGTGQDFKNDADSNMLQLSTATSMKREKISEDGLLTHFKNVRKAGDRQWMACCPVHDDRNPSLSITDAGEKWLLRCHAGCGYDAILEAVGLEQKVMTNQLEKIWSQKGRIVKVYPYQDAAGKTIVEVVRYEPKNFSRRVPNPAMPGKHIYSTKDVTWFPIYRLPAVTDAIRAGSEIHLAEGEKDADTLVSSGLTGTSLIGGAIGDSKNKSENGKWKQEYADQLKGADLVIWPDNDSAGIVHAKNLIEKLQRDCKSIRICLMPAGVKDCSELAATGKNLVEWFNAHVEPASAIGNAKSTAGKAPAEIPVAEKTISALTPRSNTVTIKNGKCTLATLADIVRTDIYFATLRYNEMSNTEEINGCGMKDTDVTLAAVHISSTFGCDCPMEKVMKIMEMVAAERCFNPVRDYLKLCRSQWDGQLRLDTFCLETLRHEGSDYARNVFRALFVQAVARSMNPGCNASLVPVFFGGHGGGKSSFVSELVPDQAWLSTSLTLSVLHDAKKAAEAVGGAWIVELPELAGITKSEVESVKAWISSHKDFYRMSYGRKSGEYLRRSIVVATSNTGDILNDPTGNRRFAPVEINPGGRIMIESTLRNQLWGEAVAMYDNNELTSIISDVEKELRERRNEQHLIEDPIRDAIMEMTEGLKSSLGFDPNDKEIRHEYSLVTLCCQARLPDKVDQIAKIAKPIGQHLRAAGWLRVRKNRGNRWGLPGLQKAESSFEDGPIPSVGSHVPFGGGNITPPWNNDFSPESD